MQYRSVHPSWLSHEDAQKVGERVTVLAQAGPVAPDDLVEDARPADAILHPLFEWDDIEAAKSWRRHQARFLIAQVEIVPAETGEPIRAFHNVTMEGKSGRLERGYVTLDTVRSEAALLEHIREEALRELSGYQKRYRQYQELNAVMEGPVLDAIRALASDAVTA